MNKLIYFAAGTISALLLVGCGPDTTKPAAHASNQPKSAKDSADLSPSSPPTVDSCDLILVPHEGKGRLDLEIIHLQQKIATERDAAKWVERLGWTFVAKARETFDPGYYKLAEHCAFCLESHQSHSAEALLLRGHVLQNLHRFKEA